MSDVYNYVEVSDIDRLGVLKAELSDLQKEHDGLVEKIKLRFLEDGVKVSDGELFRASLIVTERRTFDTAKVRTVLHGLGFDLARESELYKSTYVESVRVSARTVE